MKKLYAAIAVVLLTLLSLSATPQRLSSETVICINDDSHSVVLDLSTGSFFYSDSTGATLSGFGVVTILPAETSIVSLAAGQTVMVAIHSGFSSDVYVRRDAQPGGVCAINTAFFDNNLLAGECVSLDGPCSQ